MQPEQPLAPDEIAIKNTKMEQELKQARIERDRAKAALARLQDSMVEQEILQMQEQLALRR